MVDIPPLLDYTSFQQPTCGSIEKSIEKSTCESPRGGLFLFYKGAIVRGMEIHLGISLANLPLLPLSPQVSVGIIRGKQHEGLTELIARFALHGHFHFIVGGEWLPDQDSLRRSVRRYTTAVEETLDHPILGRPSTCLQLRDQLTMADAQQHPIFILDFLHHFDDPDVDLSLRQRVLERCCQRVQHLSRSKPVFILTQYVPTEEYQCFFPFLASIADEILEVEEHSQTEALQYSLL
jgi:hypothetical protein